jgi:hypothetical protein
MSWMLTLHSGIWPIEILARPWSTREPKILRNNGTRTTAGSGVMRELRKCLSKHRGKTVFFCGAADNEELFYRFFDKIFLLVLRPEVLKRRLVDRRDPDSNRVFIEMSLDELSGSLENAERFNMIVIWSDQGGVRNSADAVLEGIDEKPMEKLSRWTNRVTRRSTWKRATRTTISRLFKMKED